jgi:hypothetical protein
MALTRVTSGVIESNAVSAAKLANGSITSRTLSNTSIELKHLASSANWVGSVDTVTANVSIVQSNVNTVQANVNAQRTNVNIVSANVSSVAANTIKNTANINLVQDNVAKVITGLTGANTNINTVQTNVVAAESNIAAILDGTSPFTGAVTMQDTLTIQGNLYVVGAQVDLGIGSAQIDDATLLLAANTPADQGLPADSGLLINRGANANVFMGFAAYGDHIDFIFTDAPADNVFHYAISYIDVHANSFGSEGTHDETFTALHHADHPTTGIYFPAGDGIIEFVNSGSKTANILSSGNVQLVSGSIQQVDGNRLDLKRNSNIILNTADSVKLLLDVNNDDTASFFGVYNDTYDETTSIDSAVFSVRDYGEVFITDNVSVVGNANVQQNVIAQGQVYAQGTLDLVANDYATYVTLNANINAVSQNVDSGVGLIKKVNTITSTGSSNVFFVATPTATQIPSDIEKVNVFIDGIRQTPDNPGVSNNDFVYSSVNASVTITDASLPSGLTVIVDALCPRPV